MEYYSSWCKGLADNEKAIALLKASPLLVGVETFDSDAFLFLEKGIQVSIHNPVRLTSYSLEHTNFVDSIPEIVQRCNASSPSFVGFHAGYLAKQSSLVDVDELLNRCITHLRELKKYLDKEVIFETATFDSSNPLPLQAYCTTLAFIEALLPHADGYLFDITHVSVALSHLLFLEGASSSFRERFLEFAKRVGPSVKQIHFNVMHGDVSDRLYHAHDTLDSQNAQLALELLAEVVSYSPQARVITLEMDTGLAAEAHVRVLSQQAELVDAYLQKHVFSKQNFS